MPVVATTRSGEAGDALGNLTIARGTPGIGKERLERSEKKVERGGREDVR